MDWGLHHHRHRSLFGAFGAVPCGFIRAAEFCFFLTLVVGMWADVHAQQHTLEAGKFAPIERIETELKRGVSTRADVERDLGTPNGTGSAANIAGTADLWFYEHFDAASKRAEGNLYDIHMRYQVVLVFFRDDKFSGFMWFSNAGPYAAELVQ